MISNNASVENGSRVDFFFRKEFFDKNIAFTKIGEYLVLWAQITDLVK